MMIIDKHPYTLLKTRHTVEDFDQFRQRPENGDRLYELVDGEIVEKMVTEEHGVIVLNIATPIKLFSKEKQFGRVGVEINHRPAGDRYNDRIADISFTADTSRPVVKQDSVPAMPDLAIEVKSPSNTQTQLRRKAEYYLQNGCKLVWLVYPVSQQVEVCTLANDPELPGAIRIDTVSSDGVLDGGDVLRDFRLIVKDIFDL